jgi:hypothetical protein
MRGQDNTSETPFSTEFQGIEAMLNSSDGVDWVCSLITRLGSKLTNLIFQDMWESLVHMPEDFSQYEMPEEL